MKKKKESRSVATQELHTRKLQFLDTNVHVDLYRQSCDMIIFV